MTCKDCLHYDACRDAEGMDESCLTTDVEYEDMTKWCHCFKNKADFVEVVRCEKCKYFREYSDAHKRAVERADGDCYLKLTHSCDKQFIACRYNDFCSYGKG